MSGKTLFPSLGSPPGISAGAPFQLLHATFVQQVTAPFLFTDRLALVLDAPHSIVAPGFAGAAHSFVMGESAVDSANGARSLLIGYALQANTGGGATQADDQVLLGNTIVVPAASRNCAGLVAIGSSIVFTAFLGVADSFGGSVVIGQTAGLVCINAGGGDASNAIVIGPGARGHGGSVVIGATAADSDTNAIAIGQGSKAGLQAIAIGLNADATGARNISIGDRARGGTATTGTIVVGWFADGANADSGIAIGQGANLNGKTANIMLGRNAGVALDFFCQIGGDATYPINEMRFGAGFTQATGGNTYTFGVTTVFGGAGNNVAGNGLVIRSGLGTGNWANAQGLGIDLQVGLLQAGGSTQQPYTSVLALRHSDLNVALWGGMGAAFGGGAGVLYVKNATTNPAGAIAGGGLLYSTGGNLHWLSTAGVDTAITPGGGGGTSLLLNNNTFAQAKNSVGTVRNILGIDGSDRVLVGSLSEAPLRLQSAGTVECTGASFSPTLPANGNLGTVGQEWKTLLLDGAVTVTITSATTTVGAAVGTLTNAPTAGNPTGYLRVNINGAVGKIPYWV